MKPEDSHKGKTWIKRLGIGTVLFFVIKGIITSTLIYFGLAAGCN